MQLDTLFGTDLCVWANLHNAPQQKGLKPEDVVPFLEDHAASAMAERARALAAEAKLARIQTILSKE